jgi:hypothetical protein
MAPALMEIRQHLNRSPLRKMGNKKKVFSGKNLQEKHCIYMGRCNYHIILNKGTLFFYDKTKNIIMVENFELVSDNLKE